MGRLFHHKARRIRHLIPRHTNESKARMIASRSYEKGTPEWQAAYEAKLKQFNLDDQIALVKDARKSVALNEKMDLNNFNFS